VPKPIDRGFIGTVEMQFAFQGAGIDGSMDWIENDRFHGIGK
jgi:hypothetical protein